MNKSSFTAVIFLITAIFVITFTSFFANAQPWKNHKGLCVTSPFATTSFAFSTEKSGDTQRVKVSVKHHNGVQYAPFWDTQVVAEDLKMLTDKSNVILQLDSEINTSWSAKDCQWSGPNKVSCVGTGEAIKMKSNKTVEPWAFYSAVLKDSSFAGEFTYIQTTLLFYIDGQKYTFVSKYPEADCSFEP